MLSRSSASGPFDAVISDVLMPRMDGYRLGYEVRRSRDLDKTRIIVYSRTYTTLADERMALKAGADRFLRNSGGDRSHSARPPRGVTAPEDTHGVRPSG